MNTPEIPSTPVDTIPEKMTTVSQESKEPITIIPFWINNPNILLNREQMFELFPTEDMTYEQKLNAVTRTVIFLTIVGVIVAKGMGIRILLIGAITIAAIYILYFYHEKENKKTESKKTEGFSGPAANYFLENNLPLPTNVFDVPDSSNPFSNVLVTDIDYNPNKKPAPPAFNQDVNKQVLVNAKQLVANANPGQPEIVDKIFTDLGEELYFEQSLRPFHSNPGTTIPNDQGAFAEFCYGSMISCKEGNAFACARNMSHYTNY
jgi:hypothetical protein